MIYNFYNDLIHLLLGGYSNEEDIINYAHKWRLENMELWSDPPRNDDAIGSEIEFPSSQETSGLHYHVCNSSGSRDDPILIMEGN